MLLRRERRVRRTSLGDGLEAIDTHSGRARPREGGEVDDEEGGEDVERNEQPGLERRQRSCTQERTKRKRDEGRHNIRAEVSQEERPSALRGSHDEREYKRAAKTSLGACTGQQKRDDVRKQIHRTHDRPDQLEPGSCVERDGGERHKGSANEK